MPKATAQCIAAKIHAHSAKVDNQILIVPVFIAGDVDAFDFTSQLQDLEDAWNNQEPGQEWHIILRPAAH